MTGARFALLASGLGVPGTILLAAGLWAAIHLQYDWFGIAQVFCLGLLFGWVRWRSGIDPAHDADAFRVKPRCGDRDGGYHPVVPGAEPFRAREMAARRPRYRQAGEVSPGVTSRLPPLDEHATRKSRRRRTVLTVPSGRPSGRGDWTKCWLKALM